MKEIQLNQGYLALVDDADFDELNKYKWRVLKHKSKNCMYAVRRVTVYMHRAILKLEKGDGTIIDHCNQNGLDNQRKNLRPSTNSKNGQNRGKNKGTKHSKFKGLYFYKKISKWRAMITLNGKFIHLGYFDTEEEAARAYDAAAKEYHGEFACLNFPEPASALEVTSLAQC